MNERSLRILPRENPFRSERIDALAFYGDVDAIERRWAEMNHRGAIVGPEGTGKTTLQRQLLRRIEAAGHDICCVCFRPRQPAANRKAIHECRSLAPESFLFVDGAEQLGRLAWRRLLHNARRCRGLLATTHQTGYLPTLWETRTSVELLRELVIQLAGDGSVDASRLATLFHRHCGDIRQCLRALYDEFSLRVSETAVAAGHPSRGTCRSPDPETLLAPS